jgi:NAD(P)H-dependent flavin oxidoreductase YrpB (nitropropane dioxygenase family)
MQVGRDQVGVLVEARLGLLTGFRPAQGPRVLDLRLLPLASSLSEKLNRLATRPTDWVIVPASRLAELGSSDVEVVVWRSPFCSADDVTRALAQRRCGLFVTHESELAGVESRVERVLLAGLEAGGITGEESTLVLLRRVMARTAQPIWVVGGLGPDAAAGVMAAGAAGIILSDVLWSTAEAGAPQGLVDLLRRFDPSDSEDMGRHLGFPSARQLATRPPKDLEAFELTLGDGPRERAAVASWQHILDHLPGPAGVDPKQHLIPIGQSSALAPVLQRLGGVEDILGFYLARIQSNIAGMLRDYPFVEGGRLALRMGTRFPLFQGPMSQVADVPEFIAAIGEAGTMPWVAFSNMPDYVAKPLLTNTRERMAGRPFGINIIGMDSNAIATPTLPCCTSRRRRPGSWSRPARSSRPCRSESRGISTFLHTISAGHVAHCPRSRSAPRGARGCRSGRPRGQAGHGQLCQYAIEVLLTRRRRPRPFRGVGRGGRRFPTPLARFAAAMLYRSMPPGWRWACRWARPI